MINNTESSKKSGVVGDDNPYFKTSETKRKYQEEYRQKNKEVLNTKFKEYYQKNKEAINEKRRLKYKQSKEK